MKRYINPLMGVLLVMMLAGCRKDLCYNHDEHSMTVKFNAVASWICEWEDCGVHDWSQEWNSSWSRQYDEFRPEPAEGIRAVVYSGEGQPADSGTISTSTRVAQLPHKWHAIMPSTMPHMVVNCLTNPLA